MPDLPGIARLALAATDGVLLTHSAAQLAN